MGLEFNPPARPGRFLYLGAHSFEGLRTGLQATCQRVVPFGRLRINSRLTMSGGHPCELLGQASLDSRVKHENDGKEGGTGMM